MTGRPSSPKSDRDARRQDLVYLVLMLLVLVPSVVVSWVTSGPIEALILPAVAVWSFCDKWLAMRVYVEVGWKRSSDE